MKPIIFCTGITKKQGDILQRMFAYETWLRQCYGMRGSQWNPATNLYWFIQPNAAKLMEQCLMVPLDSDPKQLQQLPKIF